MSVIFKAQLKKFDSMGEKTGWTYITIPQNIADKIKPGIKRSFRVKGTIDTHMIHGVALIPIGEGDFIIAVNKEMRKAIRKQIGAHVAVKIEEDNSPLILSPGLISCLEDEPAALKHFNSLLPSHQRYYSKWIESAKTDPTRTKRIAITINALANKISFSEMLRMKQEERN